VLQLLRQQDARDAETDEQVKAGKDPGGIRRDHYLLDVRHAAHAAPRAADDAIADISRLD
jgi:hypothetical protein